MKNLLLCFLLLPCMSMGQNTQKGGMVFSKISWQKDTLGKYGYRQRIIHETDTIETLYEKTPEEVEQLLGAPDYYCKDEKRLSYIYQYEFVLPEENIEKWSTYVYKPKQECDKYLDTGSNILIDFDPTTNKVFSIGYVIKN